MSAEAKTEELTYEPLEERAFERAMAAVAEQLRRHQPTMVIR